MDCQIRDRVASVAAGITLVFVLAVGLGSQPRTPSGDPDAARLVTSDIARFWSALDGATDADRAERLQREYLDGGSAGVKAFVPNRILSGAELAAAISRHPDRYSPEVRARTLRLLQFERRLRAPLYAVKYLYPPAVFPEVYFVIGRLNSGGTSADAGLIIGAEMYARTDESLERLPHIVAHEWTHFNQQYGPIETLLAQSLHEGAADFIAELASGAHTNQEQHAFARDREAEIWKRFAPVMHHPWRAKTTAGWMYGGSVIENGPPDLAYYVGYKICDAYYRRAADKRKAIADILNIRDFKAFLAASGYAGPPEP